MSHLRATTAIKLAVMGTLFCVTSASAQFPEEFHNLEVLPKDISQGDLRNTMVGFAFGLGVRCEHCHVGEPGEPLSTFDFESDEKETKRKARIMLRMVAAINDQHLPGLSAEGERAKPAVRVACVTCHRGLSIPRTLDDELGNTIAADGIDAAVARYRELREEYYGSGSYDFSEQTLIRMAGGLGREDPVAAVRLLELNIEYFPESWRSWATIAQFKLRQGDKAGALEAARVAQGISPDNPGIARLITQIEGG